ncbi:MAG TPA: hypothetical protein V6D17_22255 [Candidatus Obscuribacterales bacterium]
MQGKREFPTMSHDKNTSTHEQQLGCFHDHWSFTSPEREFQGCLGMPSHEWLVRIAERTNLEEILAILSISPIAQIRVAVADNCNTPEHILALLAKDADADVRYAMAENHNLKKEILQILEEDDNPYISSRASKTLSRLRAGAVIHAKFKAGFGRDNGACMA